MSQVKKKIPLVHTDRTLKLAEKKLSSMRPGWEKLFLSSACDTYRKLRNGTDFIKIDSLDDLGISVVYARVASGLTQPQLAKKLGCFKQEVQRMESLRYSTVSITRISEVLKVMDCKIQIGGMGGIRINQKTNERKNNKKGTL